MEHTLVRLALEHQMGAHEYQVAQGDLSTQPSQIFNVAPCMLPHLLYNPSHALFTL